VLVLNTGDRFLAARAALGEELSIAVATEVMVVLDGKLLAAKQFVAVAASEAVGVHRRIAVVQPAIVDHLHSNTARI